jgi:hypothetical protein
LQPGFKLIDPALLGTLECLGFAIGLENSVAVLEELHLPAGEQIWGSMTSSSQR